MSIDKIDISDAESMISRAGLDGYISVVATLDDGAVYVLDGGGRHYVKTMSELHTTVRESIASYENLD